MSEPLEAKRPTTVVKCEKHGLHYDSARMDGCVICRREAGGGRTAAAARTASQGSLGQALAVTAILLLLATAGLYFLHGMVAESLQGRGEINAFGAGFEEPLPDPSFPEVDEGGPVYSGAEGD